MLSVNRTPRLFPILSRSHPLLFLCSFFTVCVERRVFCEAGAFAVVKSLQGELGNFLTSLVMLFTLSTVVWQFFFSDFFCISKLMLKISACFSKLMSKTDFQFKFRLFSRFQSKPFSVCFVLLRRLSFFFLLLFFSFLKKKKHLVLACCLCKKYFLLINSVVLKS